MVHSRKWHHLRSLCSIQFKMKTPLLLVFYVPVVTELCWTGKGMVVKNQCNHMARYEQTTPQHPPVHVRSIHQSMPIMTSLSVELRGLVQTVGGTLLIFNLHFVQKTTLTAMVLNFN